MAQQRDIITQQVLIVKNLKIAHRNEFILSILLSKQKKIRYRPIFRYTLWGFAGRHPGLCH